MARINRGGEPVHPLERNAASEVVGDPSGSGFDSHSLRHYRYLYWILSGLAAGGELALWYIIPQVIRDITLSFAAVLTSNHYINKTIGSAGLKAKSCNYVVVHITFCVSFGIDDNVCEGCKSVKLTFRSVLNSSVKGEMLVLFLSSIIISVLLGISIRSKMHMSNMPMADGLLNRFKLLPFPYAV